MGSGDGQFQEPKGIAVDSAGNNYVADTTNMGGDYINSYIHNRVQKFDSGGKFIAQWGSYGSSDGQFQNPIGVAVDSAGNVYVADAGNYRVQKFDSDGKFIAKFGSYGKGDGQFSNLNGVAVDSSGYVYVADGGANHRIQKFSLSTSRLSLMSFLHVTEVNLVITTLMGGFLAALIGRSVKRFPLGATWAGITFFATIICMYLVVFGPLIGVAIGFYLTKPPPGWVWASTGKEYSLYYTPIMIVVGVLVGVFGPIVYYYSLWGWLGARLLRNIGANTPIKIGAFLGVIELIDVVILLIM